MRVRFWGTRGSLATPGPETARYGGNTSCVSVGGDDGSVLVLDAGTGIRRLGGTLMSGFQRVDLLLTHLHMDHLQGLGFFAPLFNPAMEVHIWGPASTTMTLDSRLARYLSPPLFPVRLRDLPCRLTLHHVPDEPIQIGEFTIESTFVCHPGPTAGFRIAGPAGVLVYLPDHEPALGQQRKPWDASWTSGLALAQGADVLIHDAQYSQEQYGRAVGWGHSSIDDALHFAGLAGVKTFVPFHYDPGNDDEQLDRMFEELRGRNPHACRIIPAQEGMTIELRELD